MGNDRTRCRACGKPILFIKTAKGKTIPVDVRPLQFVPDANGRSLYVTDEGDVIHGVPAQEMDPDKHTGYISHFATCTNPDDFRSRPRKKERKEVRR